MNKILTFDNLKDSAQQWAIEQVNIKHPVQSRSETLDQLLALYEYNCYGDIIDYHVDPEQGQDPEYYSDILGD